MPFEFESDRLAEQATVLKKAWLMCVALIGREHCGVGRRDLVLDDYTSWKKSQVAEEVSTLRETLTGILRGEFRLRPGKAAVMTSARNLAVKFDQFHAAGLRVFSAGTVQEFEQAVGAFRNPGQMELPPYGEVLLQGFEGMAIRHPEYMLVRDLGLMLDLYADCEQLADAATASEADWRWPAGENAQSLARAVIITCFNLLEAFTSGLAQAYLMTQANVDERMADKLRSNRDPLKTRLIKVVLATGDGRTRLDVNKPPMSVMFGPIKHRRDAFVHCMPSSTSALSEYEKQAAFHDVRPAIVHDAVKLTCEIIRTAWRDVHGVEGPRWLPELEGNRFGKPNLRLSPVPYSSA